MPQAPDGIRQPAVGRSLIAKCRKPCPEACFDEFGVGGRQRVLGGQASVGPGGRFVSGLKVAELGHQPIPQRRRLICSQNGLRQRLLASGTRWYRQAGGEGVPVQLLPIGSGWLFGARFGGGPVIRRIEVVFPGDPHQREQRVAPGVGQGSAHPMRRRRLARRTHRPIR